MLLQLLRLQLQLQLQRLMSRSRGGQRPSAAGESATSQTVAASWTNMTSQAPLDPVFLLSPARSYSSVLAAVFGGHPQVYGFPELRLFIGESIAAVMRSQDHLPQAWSYFARSGLVRSVAELIVGSQSSSDIDAAFSWLGERSTWQPSAVFDVLRAAVAP